ncbi:hypothetical protein [Microbispora sp. H13382]|uniref:hypothetical protein n=1 Tax=Microbispora sp. H13382 TaxID=2729112 RepID=UPI0016027167|nr:hypothetical protein [Microbispora sp. H13382]
MKIDPNAQPTREEEQMLARVEASNQRHRAADAASLVDGRHYTEWVPLLDQYRTQKRDDDALALLARIFPAVEAQARILGGSPAPGYYERAAIIHRRKKDYAAEVAILERYVTLCPPGFVHEGFATRLDKARKLLSGQR